MTHVSPFVYAHPAMATVALLLAFLVFRQGFHQRRLRLRRVTPPAGNLNRHLRLGPWVVGLVVLATVGGVGSAVQLRGWKPLATTHGWVALVAMAGFVSLWLLGRSLQQGRRQLAAAHGLVGLFTLFAAGLAGVLGISLLP